MRILVVEDDRKVADFIAEGLHEEGHAVEIAADGEAALDSLCAGPSYDLAILDFTLPRRDGFAIVKAAREAGVQTPILILTARDSVSDKVTGLDVGADDYLTKPFAFAEFLARVRALLRRGSAQRDPMLRLADLVLDPATRRVTRGERTISLTLREYALLECLLRNAGRVLTRAMLAERVWGLNADPESNIVDVCVGNLRRKIDTTESPRLFHTLRGVGYLLGLQE
jgi:DNA-binding response OmpR family regulator